jgi:peptidoglycan hydrolase-like protein with peptidoglycan-binding domain
VFLQMSRTHWILVAALAGVAALLGAAQFVEPDESSASVTTTSSPPTAASTAAPTTTTTAPAWPVVDGESTSSTAAPTSSVLDPVDGDVTTTTVKALVTIDLPGATSCTVSEPLQEGAEGDEVDCVQSKLTSFGYPVSGGAYDSATAQAVRAYQTAKGFEPDGVVDRVTGQALGIWKGDGPVDAVEGNCPDSGNAAIIDRDGQRGWLCEEGRLGPEFPLSSAWSQPDPGTYEVFDKDLESSSNIGGKFSTMTHFVSFTYGKFQGARIAFHSVPRYANGEWVQPLDTVGDLDRRGESAGCLRVLPDDAQRIWDLLEVGDQVRVLS